MAGQNLVLGSGAAVGLGVAKGHIGKPRVVIVGARFSNTSVLIRALTAIAVVETVQTVHELDGVFELHAPERVAGFSSRRGRRGKGERRRNRSRRYGDPRHP